jgi:hypothetical protein
VRRRRFLTLAGSTIGAAAFGGARLFAQSIAATRLGDRLTLLTNAEGRNVVALHGPDGVLLVNTFASNERDDLQRALGGVSRERLAAVIDRHWRDAYAASSVDDTHTLTMNGETVTAFAFEPASTDTDLVVRFARADVLYLGDIFINGGYPRFDLDRGGHITGMVAAANRALSMVSATTRIVPGRGPVADRDRLIAYRDMLVGVRHAIRVLRAEHKTLAESQAARPTRAYDPIWGAGAMRPDDFVALVYESVGREPAWRGKAPTDFQGHTIARAVLE